MFRLLPKRFQVWVESPTPGTWDLVQTGLTKEQAEFYAGMRRSFGRNVRVEEE